MSAGFGCTICRPEPRFSPEIRRHGCRIHRGDGPSVRIAPLMVTGAMCFICPGRPQFLLARRGALGTRFDLPLAEDRHTLAAMFNGAVEVGVGESGAAPVLCAGQQARFDRQAWERSRKPSRAARSGRNAFCWRRK